MKIPATATGVPIRRQKPQDIIEHDDLPPASIAKPVGNMQLFQADHRFPGLPAPGRLCLHRSASRGEVIHYFHALTDRWLHLAPHPGFPGGHEIDLARVFG